MRLPPRQYLGTTVRQWHLDGLTLTLTRYPEFQRQPWHEHEHANLFLLIRGAFLDSRKGDNPRLLDRITMIFHPPEIMHACEAGPEGRAGLNIEPTPEWLSRFGIDRQDLGRYRVVDEPVSITSAIRLFLSACSLEDEDDNFLHDHVFELLVPHFTVDSTLDKLESTKWFKRVFDLLNAPGDASLSLSAVAKEIEVHPVYLARVFRERIGCSMGEYIQRQRLCRASEMVLRKGSALGQAAHEAGFADQAHFSRVFNRMMGSQARQLLKARQALLA